MMIHSTPSEESGRRASAGCTLVELLVATTIIAVIMLGVYQSFAAALASWHRTEAELGTAGEGRGFVTRLARELASAVVLALPEDEVCFKGGPERLTFFTTAGLGDRSVRPALAVTKVTYEFPGSQGGSRGGGLAVRRARQFFSGSYPVSEEAGITVLSGVRKVKIEYLVAGGPGGRVEWREGWESKSQLPIAVRIALELEKPEASQDGRTMLFRTVVPMGPRLAVE